MTTPTTLTATPPRSAPNTGELRLLTDAVDALARFLNPTDEQCAVPADVREAARIYLSSWVAGPLVAALSSITSTADLDDRLWVREQQQDSGSRQFVAQQLANATARLAERV